MANQPTKYKKFLAGAASATLVATAIVPTALAAEVEKAATDFSDVAATHTHYAAIMQAVERGLFDGYTDGTFKPENSIDRKGVVKSLAKYVIAQSEHKTFEEYITANKLADKVTPFNDVPATHGDAELFNASLIVKDSGIFTGSNNNLMPANVITRQQMAKVLVNGFGLKDLAGVESEVTDTDKAQDQYVDFINILSENNVTEVTTFNPTGAVKRGQMASFLNRAYDAAHKVVAPETATKVVSVSATNLKEIVVAFDGSVDVASAEEEDNYSTTAGDIESAQLSEDGKSVLLTLGQKTDGSEINMTNQKNYKLSVSNVKAGDKEVEITDFGFMPLDNVLPDVTSVVSLGNKAVKVVFSEPVKKAAAANFKLDDKTFYGSVTVEGREVVLKPYDASALTIGAHKLSVSLVEDYAGLKSLTTTNDFTIVEDKEGPTASAITATLESATITFNEDLDPSTVVAGDVYWMSGSTKMKAGDFTKLAGNKYVFDFSGNPIPAYETTLYIDSVSDYSGNANSVKEYKVHATVDQTRPSVVDVDFDATVDNNTITVKFSKAVSAADKKFFTITDKDGKVVPVSNVTADTANKVFNVNLYSALPAGVNTLKVSGVQDTTTLKNTMLDFTTEVAVGDHSQPKIADVTVSSNAANKTVVVGFGEKMDPATISNPANYLIEFDAGAGAVTRQLPADAEITVVQDGKAALIQFPDEIGNTPVTIGVGSNAGASLKSIKVMNVKDLAGNLLDQYSTAFIDVEEVEAATAEYDGLTNDYLDREAVFVDTKTIKVKFDQLIGSVRPSDFTLTNNGANVTIESAVSNGTNVVTIKTTDSLGTDGDALALRTSATQTIKTVTGNLVEDDASITIYDEVSPAVKPTVKVGGVDVLAFAGNTITLPFSEDLATGAALEALYANDLIVTDLSDPSNPLKGGAGFDYTTTVATVNGVDVIQVTLAAGSDLTADYSVKVKADAKYIQDETYGNFATESSAYETTNNTVTAAPGTPVITTVAQTINAADITLTGTAQANSTVTVTGGSSTVTAVTNGSGAYSVLVPLTQDAVNTLSVTATNAVGTSAAATVVITEDGTAPTASVTTGNATGLVLTYNEALYNGTTAIASGDVKALFTAADVSLPGTTPLVITSATYDAATKAVTFVISGAEATDTITVNGTVKDAAGNVVDATDDVATFGGVTWTLN